ncbi:MAG: PIG-L family deacetylase, partial [Verrucomicrobia bacterium]|nr:PIG-L family deacetylase [Verrucomicrobiota bacterium]
MNQPTKILSVHAHFDDFEFVAAGTFLLWKRKLGDALRARILVCTDGAAGHHFRSRKETAKIRLREQAASAKIGGFEWDALRLPNGRVPRDGALQSDAPTLAGLWRAIRDFEPDHLFCPPLPADPLAGVHADHAAVADAVRKVAYLINVPHAFTPEYPADETISRPCKTPVILNVYDKYMAGGTFDYALDVEDVFPTICEMTYCHQSQINEWLPWVDPANFQSCKSLAEWSRILRRRFERRNALLGIKTKRALEIFTLTAWGAAP